MRALLIDPSHPGFIAINEVDFDGTLVHMYKLLDCQTIDAVWIGGQHTVYIDDEGLLYGDDTLTKRGFFTFPGGSIYAGKGLVVKIDREGKDIPATIPLGQLAEIINSVPLEAGLHHAHNAGIEFKEAS